MDGGSQCPSYSMRRVWLRAERGFRVSVSVLSDLASKTHNNNDNCPYDYYNDTKNIPKEWHVTNLFGFLYLFRFFSTFLCNSSTFSNERKKYVCLLFCFILLCSVQFSSVLLSCEQKSEIWNLKGRSSERRWRRLVIYFIRFLPICVRPLNTFYCVRCCSGRFLCARPFV